MAFLKDTSDFLYNYQKTIAAVTGVAALVALVFYPPAWLLFSSVVATVAEYIAAYVAVAYLDMVATGLVAGFVALATAATTSFFTSAFSALLSYIDGCFVDGKPVSEHSSEHSSEHGTDHDDDDDHGSEHSTDHDDDHGSEHAITAEQVEERRAAAEAQSLFFPSLLVAANEDHADVSSHESRGPAVIG